MLMGNISFTIHPYLPVILAPANTWFLQLIKASGCL